MRYAIGYLVGGLCAVVLVHYLNARDAICLIFFGAAVAYFLNPEG